MLALQSQQLFMYLLTNNKINCGSWEDIVNDLLSIFQNPEMIFMAICSAISALIIPVVIYLIISDK